MRRDEFPQLGVTPAKAGVQLQSSILAKRKLNPGLRRDDAPLKLILLLLLLLPGPAFAFDCGKAGTAVEKAICADPELKRLDDELEAAYAAVKSASSPDQQKLLSRSERRWVKAREFCMDGPGGISACVRGREAERLSLLTGAPMSGPGAPGKLTPVFIVQDGTPQQWDIDIALLRFADPQSPGERSFNAKVDEITSGATLGSHGQSEGRIYEQQNEMSLTYASPRLISARVFSYVDEGGAHGNSFISNINIDMASGRELTAATLLSQPSAAILTLWCKKQIDAAREKRVPESIDVPYDEPSRDKAIAGTVRDLTRWSIGEEEIVVSFDPYVVGSYAEGRYECRFPTKGVKELAGKDAALP